MRCNRYMAFFIILLSGLSLLRPLSACTYMGGDYYITNPNFHNHSASGDKIVTQHQYTDITLFLDAYLGKGRWRWSNDNELSYSAPQVSANEGQDMIGADIHIVNTSDFTLEYFLQSYVRPWQRPVNQISINYYQQQAAFTFSTHIHSHRYRSRLYDWSKGFVILKPSDTQQPALVTRPQLINVPLCLPPFYTVTETEAQQRNRGLCNAWHSKDNPACIILNETF